MNDMHQFDKDKFFDLLDENEKKLVMERLQKDNFSTGEYVFKENDSDDKLYIVEQGTVSLVKSIGNDFDKTVLVATEGMIFGEFSFIDGSKRSAAALVTHDSILLSLNRQDFDVLNKEYPAIGTKLYNNLLLTLTIRIRQTSEAHWSTIENVIKNKKWINPDVA